MGSADHYTASDFIDVIPGTGGIISTIAARVGCDWHTAKRYIDNYATVKQAYDDECEKVTDLAETQIIKGIKENDLPTAKWYLTMKGHSRGYVRREEREISGADGEPLIPKIIELVIGEETEEERRLIIDDE